MPKGQNFDEIYGSIEKNYSNLEKIMADLYEQLENNPTNEMLKNILFGLGDVAKGMIDSQMNLVILSDGISEEDRKYLTSVLERKMQDLLKAIDLTKAIASIPKAR